MNQYHYITKTRKILPISSESIFESLGRFAYYETKELNFNFVSIPYIQSNSLTLFDHARVGFKFFVNLLTNYRQHLIKYG